MNYSLIVYIILGIIPSSVWLLYYLKKDLHPEPKKQILIIFLWGAFITIPVFFVQYGATKLLEFTNFSVPIKTILQWFVVIAFTEELFKFLVVRIKIIGNSVLDEPLDLMLYMVVSALGFAAIENILYLLTPTGQMSIDDVISRTLIIFFIRFVGSTFLHTLCSSILGYSLAMSICNPNRKYAYIILGIVIATFFHGLYNLSFIRLTSYVQLAIPASILVILAVAVFIGFNKLKKLKGVCRIVK